MKPLARLLLYINLILVSCHFHLSAQEQKNPNLLHESLSLTEDNGKPHPKFWRYDWQDFRLTEGNLFLDSKEHKQSLLITSLDYAPSIFWSGQIKLDFIPNAQNKVYLLLYNIADRNEPINDYTTRYEYLALSIGKEDRHITTLVILNFVIEWEQEPNASNSHSNRAKKISYLQDETLAETLEYPTNIPYILDYEVSYTKERGLSAKLHFPLSPKDGVVQERIELDEAFNIQAGRNSFGIMAHYNKANRQAMSFEKLYVSSQKAKESTSEKSEEDKKKPKPEPKQEKPSIKKQQKALITEIMAYPLLGSSPYIELYNPNDEALQLKDYTLGFSTDLQRPKKVYTLAHLPDIPAKTYIILSPNPPAIKRQYPHCPSEQLYLFDLPTISTSKSSYVWLFREKALEDIVKFQPADLIIKGKKERGVAYERIGLSAIEHYLDEVRWQSGSMPYGYATPCRANSPDRKGKANLAPPSQQSLEGNRSQTMKSLEEFQYITAVSPNKELELNIYRLDGQKVYQCHKPQSREFLYHISEAKAWQRPYAIEKGTILIWQFRLKNTAKEETYRVFNLKTSTY